MPVKNETSTRCADEIRNISPWAYVFALLGFLSIIAVVMCATLTDKNAPPIAVMVLVGVFAGAILACYIVLIGYVNRDAGRRGMSRVLWTLIAIFVPNGLGIVLYFVLRKPRISHCPQCSASVEPQFGFCPRCRCRLGQVCPQCQRGVNAGDKFCPYCGADLGAVTDAVVSGERKNQ